MPIPRLALISLILFGVVHLPKGGPADVYAADPAATPEAIERMKEIWGLDQPLGVQYLRWVGNLLRGDWGRSYVERRPALDVVMSRLPNTLRLTGAALLYGLVVGVGLGVLVLVDVVVVGFAVLLLVDVGLTVVSQAGLGLRTQTLFSHASMVQTLPSRHSMAVVQQLGLTVYTHLPS